MVGPVEPGSTTTLPLCYRLLMSLPTLVVAVGERNILSNPGSLAPSLIRSVINDHHLHIGPTVRT